MPAFLNEPLHPELLTTDENFDRLYAPRIQQLSEKHWTPLNISRLAAAFLAENSEAQILDIGAGVGKFCIAAAQQHPDCHFYGVEQRRNLVHFAEKTARRLDLKNVTFLHADFTKINLNKFDHFYFYNSFYENLVDEDFRIDGSVAHSEVLYDYYTHYLHGVFAGRPSGTRLVTYHSSNEVVPGNYTLVDTKARGVLKFWVRD
jgi:SAM-dependent methyltransferase